VGLIGVQWGTAPMSELTVLRAVRLKGRISPAEVAVTIGEDPAEVAATIRGLGNARLLVEGASVKLTPAGRDRLQTLLAEERSQFDDVALAAVYREFCPVTDFKALVTRCQIKGISPMRMTTPTTTLQC
jgi:hypothetical protein